MATVTKAVLKTYFNAGDIPTEGQYVDLIDSSLNLGETGTQIIQGTISASAAEIEYITQKTLYLQGNGIDSMKVGTTFAVGKTLEVSGSLRIEEGSISASGDLIITKISASGIISSSNSLVTNEITASGNISASGGITGSHIYSSANILAGNRVTSDYGTVNYSLVVNENGHGGGDFRVESDTNSYQIFSDANTDKVGIGYTSAPTLTSLLNINGDITSTHITASGNISGSGTSTLTMGGTATLSSLTLTEKEDTVAVYTWDAGSTINRKAWQITTTVPSLRDINDDSGGNNTEIQAITNDEIKATSVIIANASAVGLNVVCSRIAVGSFNFHIINTSDTDFTSATVLINFVVL